jgi:hypothetical protein
VNSQAVDEDGHRVVLIEMVEIIDEEEPSTMAADLRMALSELLRKAELAGSRRHDMSESGGGSCANIPATHWTAGRYRRIDFSQERELTKL